MKIFTQEGENIHRNAGGNHVYNTTLYLVGNMRLADHRLSDLDEAKEVAAGKAAFVLLYCLYFF